MLIKQYKYQKKAWAQWEGKNYKHQTIEANQLEKHFTIFILIYLNKKKKLSNNNNMRILWRQILNSETKKVTNLELKASRRNLEEHYKTLKIDNLRQDIRMLIQKKLLLTLIKLPILCIKWNFCSQNYR